MRTITIDVLPQKKSSTKTTRWWKSWWLWGPLLGVLVLLVGLGGLLYWRVTPMIASSKAVVAQVEVLKVAAKDQNMEALNKGLPELQSRLDVLRAQVQWFSFVRHWPVAGAYYQDSEHLFIGATEGLTGGQILVRGVEPYADVLGFKGATTGPAKPTDERISELTLLMPSLLPSLDKAQEHFELLNQEMDQINVARYPGKVGNANIRQSLTEVKEQVASLEDGIHQARPLLAILPQVMGAPDAKKYLILFQNDKELRPTGGFITSVAYINFDKGKFTVSDTGDIYTIDKGKAYLPLPAPIKTYLNVPQWNMRDTNFSPDFVKSMQDFEYYYKKSGDRPIDGIIALDTQFVEGLMEKTGPLTVKGYKEPFSAAPIKVNGTSVPQVVYQLEMIAEKSGLEGDARKGILGDLMQEIIKKVLSDPASTWPGYVAMLQKQGQEKHILLNFHDAQAQSLAEDQNFAGRITEPATAQDYLHINDANLAGLKSNFYLTQAAKRDITIDDDGTVHEKLSITYKNTGKFDGWLNANAHNYLRVYVPQGSKLVKSSGGDQKTTTSTDLGKTVFDNFVLVHPLQSRTVVLEYTLPFKMTKSYSSIIQKQPGAKNWDYTTIVNGQSQQTLIDGDKIITAKQ